MSHPSEIFDSTVFLMTQIPPGSSTQAKAIQKAGQTQGPFYKSKDTISIEQARTRRSAQSFGKLDLSQLAELLYLSLFNTEEDGLRPYPAAGGIYTNHLYLVCNKVDELKSGIHYVRWADQTLELIGPEETAKLFIENSVVQPNKESIPLIALLVADTRLSKSKYHDRSIRMGLIEAGALLQTLYLAGTKLGLSICGLGAISDRAALRVSKLEPCPEVIFACGVAIGGSNTAADLFK